MLKKMTKYGTVSAHTFEDKDATGIAFGLYKKETIISIEGRKHGLVVLLNERALREQGIEVIYVDSFSADDLAKIEN